MKKIHIDANQGENENGLTFGFLWTDETEIGMFFTYPISSDGELPNTMSVVEKDACVESLEYDEEGWKTGAKVNISERRARVALRKFLDRKYDSRRA